MQKKQTIIKISITAVLICMTVIANRFLSFNVWNLSLGFSFFPVLICSCALGSLYGGICGGLADLIGAIFFPFGPFFPGFTITAFLSGFLFGLIPKNADKKVFFVSALAVFLAEEILCTVLLNSVWISFLYSSPVFPLILTRSLKAAVMLLIEMAAIFVIKAHILKPIEKMLREK